MKHKLLVVVVTVVLVVLWSQAWDNVPWYSAAVAGVIIGLIISPIINTKNYEKI
ncbi:MAG: hypothetical protein HPY79_10510 [Bacteroidales bacterium]|nr:hypothetical protein [Bacteroidales bacterium]